MTFDGFPLGFEVFAGNTHDSQTLQTIVATMEARHGVLGRVWIADRGMASAENLAWLRQTGRRYIIGAPKSELKKFAAELARRDGWRAVREGVEVKLVRHPETDETVILCRSADRRSKEHAMHDKFSRRIEQALERLSARLARAKKPLDAARVNRQIGRSLVLAASSAGLGVEPLVSGAGRRREGTNPPDRHRRAGPQTARRLVALRHPRRRSRRRRVQGGMTRWLNPAPTRQRWLHDLTPFQRS